MGGEVDPQGRAIVTVGPDQTLEARALVTDTASAASSSTDLEFILTDLSNGDKAVTSEQFKAP